MATFEEAKKKWLKENKGKTWEDLVLEEEAKTEALADKLMTPEYLKEWEEMGKSDDDETEE